MNTRPLLVVGCGNPYAGDDGAGPYFVEKLDETTVGECDLMSVLHPDVTLLESFRGRELVVIVDAVSTGAPPGTVCIVPLPCATVEPRSFANLSGHAIGVSEILGLGRALGRPLPPIVLLGIEIGQVEKGRGMSREVSTAVESLVARFGQVLVETGAAAFA